MGFAIGFRATAPVSPEVQRRAEAALEPLIAARTWLSCEPPLLGEFDGEYGGASKPNFSPHPADVKAARAKGLPDGTVHDLVDCLCVISQQFGIEFALSHNYSGGAIGYVRDGVCDEGTRSLVSAFADLLKSMAEMGYDNNHSHRWPT